MDVRGSRKFGLLDAILLVAASALGAVSLRPSLYHSRESLEIFRDLYPGAATSLYTHVAIRVVEPWLVAFTAAFLVIRLRPDRPPIVRLARQAGTAAGFALAVVVLANGLLAGLDIAVMGTPPREDLHHTFYPGILGGAGAAVAAVWGLMAVGRRWRAEPEWIDRLGRFLGVCWIAISLVGTWEDFWFSSMEIRSSPPPPSPAQVAFEKQQEAFRKQQRADREALTKKLDAEFKALRNDQERRDVRRKETPERDEELKGSRRPPQN